MILVAAVKYSYIVPVVVFSAYLIYGLIRPWLSQAWRKGIEVESEADDEEDDAAPPRNPAGPV